MKSEITGGVEEADAGGDVVSGEVAGENWKGASHVWRSPGRSTAWGVRLARGPAGYRAQATRTQGCHSAIRLMEEDEDD